MTSRPIKIFIIALIILQLSLIFPIKGQANPQLVQVYIDGIFKYSPEPVYLKATALYNDGSTKDVTYSGNWESSNENIATVYRGKVEFQNRIGEVTITFSYGGLEDTVNTEVVDITEIKIKNSSLNYSEEPVQLEVEGRINDGEMEEITDNLIWSSSNTDVARVNSNGLVTFTGETGTATITVQYTSPLTGRVRTDDLPVTVDPDDVEEEEEIMAYTLKIEGDLDPDKKTSTLKAYKLYEDDSKKALKNDLVSWESSNPYVAEIDNNGKVTFTGKPGSVTITARYKNRSASLETFVPYKLKKLIINQSLNFTPYFFKYPPKLTVSGIDNSGKKQLLANIEWTSNPEDIALINDKGQITFTGKPGTVTFTAKKDELTDSITCTIPETEAKKLKDILITENLFYSKNPQNLKVLAVYSDGTTKEVTRECSWSSSNESIAKVIEGTVYFSGSPGVVEITCFYQGLSDRVKTIVSVPGKNLELNGIKFLHHGLTSNDNGQELLVYGLYSDNTKKILRNVQFHSYQPNIVKIQGNKLYFTGNPGKAVIEAEKNMFRDTLEIEVENPLGKNIPLFVKVLGDMDSYLKTKELKAYAVYSDGRIEDITRKAVWNTSNKTIAQVIDKGKIEMVDNGPVRISVSDGNHLVFLSNKPYYQFGKINPINTTIVPLETLKEKIQNKLSRNLYIPVPEDIYGHWAQKDIILARKLGWMGGYPDGSMKPDKPITRGEFASLLERSLYLKTDNRYIQFTDTNNHWAQESINIIANLGLVPFDTNNHKFRPNDYLTREEMAQIISNLINVRADSYYQYIDVSPGHPSGTAIANVSQAKIMNGIDTVHFKPNEPATRAQALAVLLRLLKSDPELEGILNRF